MAAPENAPGFLKGARLSAGERRQTEFEASLVHIVNLRPARVA